MDGSDANAAIVGSAGELAAEMAALGARARDAAAALALAAPAGIRCFSL